MLGCLFSKCFKASIKNHSLWQYKSTTVRANFFSEMWIWWRFEISKTTTCPFRGGKYVTSCSSTFSRSVFFHAVHSLGFDRHYQFVIWFHKIAFWVIVNLSLAIMASYSRNECFHKRLHNRCNALTSSEGCRKGAFLLGLCFAAPNTLACFWCWSFLQIRKKC